ncbi:MAG: ribbon-helix-helix protein, CopG family [Candidatus Riflebacteria bacterium]|nr:ribbon-helix-helix protein, CopG family [Candidatus Riflebacteria bacterium]
MRTTISLSDRLAKLVRRKASERGMSVSAYIAEVLDDAVKRHEPGEVKPFRLVTVDGGGPIGTVDLDRPRALFVTEEEDAYKR